ncbi:unnamed protein product [Mortierella alpina]
MKSRQSTTLWAFGLATLVFTTSTLQPATTFAAPVSAPSPGSSVPPTQSNVPLASEDCRRCLAQELIRIPQCDSSLSASTPALLPSEKDPVKIEEYKNYFPDVVECLCKAASLARGSGGWVKRCDAVCTVAVERNQRRILNAFSEQFSCESSADSAPSVSSSLSDPSLSKPAVETEPKSRPSPSDSSSSRQPWSNAPAKVAPAAAGMPATSVRSSIASNTHSVHPARSQEGLAT